MDKLNDSNFYVGWGTLALINANLARANGRSRLAWFFASLFFGPLATFVLLIVDPPKPPSTPTA